MRKMGTARLHTSVCIIEPGTVELQAAFSISACNKHRRKTIAAVDVMNCVFAALAPHMNHITVALTQILVWYLLTQL